MSIFRPNTEAELADIVTWANDADQTLEIVGGGSKRLSAQPIEAMTIVETGAQAGILSYEPAELVMTARAGTPLQDIVSVLAERGQVLAFDPPMLRGATIGGVIAVNDAGPRRLRQGAARDHFLGFRAVSGRGDVFKAGGKVVKNVTGFDLPKLMAGSWGTLAILTEVTVKVMPRPVTETTFIIRGLDDVAAIALLAGLMGGPDEIGSATHQSANASQAAATAIRIEGFPSSVAARRVELADRLGRCSMLEEGASVAFWAALRDAEPLADDPRPLWRIALPPATGVLGPIVGNMRFDWAGALLWLRSDAADAAIHAAALAAGGYARRAARRPPVPHDSALAAIGERVRHGFDPNRVLNPGRTATGLAA